MRTYSPTSRGAPGVTLALVLLSAVLPPASRSFAATWQALDYGGSDTMSVYKPSTATSSPALIVALHTCGGSMAMAQGWFQSLADKYGFLIIAGKSAGGCWDAGLGRSGERATIVQAVSYAIQSFNVDKSRVFAAGASSGACMTQALLASYPDVFAAGSSLAAVPAGAWTGGGNYGWSTPSSTTAQQWGDKVRQADPGFAGSRPRIQLWQGQGDTNLTYAVNFPAEVGQWTNVLGVTDADATKTSIKPAGATDTWDRTSYKNSAGVLVVEANVGPSNVPHDLTPRGLWPDVVRFFGLDGSAPATPSDGGGLGTGGASGPAGTGGSNGEGGGGGQDARPSSSGGQPGPGGISGRGGADATAGVSSSGGSAATGGVGSGGRTIGPTSVGGATDSGGVRASGGASSNGASAASGGAQSSGTASGGASGGSSPGSASGSTGCGCDIGSRSHRASPILIVLMVMALSLGFHSEVRGRWAKRRTGDAKTTGWS